jgi:hypothetical protein
MFSETMSIVACGKPGFVMQNAMNLIVLMCAASAALAFGVLAAYGICRAAFAILKIHARSYAKVPQAKPEIARIA